MYVIFFPAELPNDQTRQFSCLLAFCSRNILKFATQLEAKTVYILSLYYKTFFSAEVLLRVVTAVQMLLALYKKILEEFSKLKFRKSNYISSLQSQKVFSLFRLLS